MSYVVGIDPGATGALAFFNNGYLFGLEDMPKVNKDVAPGPLCDLLALFDDDCPAAAVVELAQSMPGQGVAGMFRYGKGYGVVLGALAALRIPVHHARPSEWKRDLGLTKRPGEKLNDLKERSRKMALDLWPHMSHRLDRKKDSGRAEAALIGHWWITKGER